ncbi:NAD-dependent succinate-semialdehyde dehydrogenase [Nesterenkonia sp. E16_7]|uniref:NAD-dependent succinate-semialdehyde dehydrogenase n=1 Tax=unclassified Nesterenkonia TaxID=2629769 RepID=UPI001A913AD8|nr:MULTISPECIES: NAD-dependent succinate-semialdehyde dehydrogenase [unclassified Nesterenkonia]MBO0595708.1 NAD-dependent succinate-semialdehyde dehydrogenase [Nesterenkonia sp. E16_10]MBO0600016.1 NAD-dependent succinate-semialdehyde dehydrogenase [Nesterenkonia sp. E16_7]
MTTQDIATTLLSRVPTGLLIGGHFVSSAGHGQFDVTNPATGETLIAVADATVDDAKQALDRACDAQESWKRTAPQVRADILRRAYELMLEQAEDLALLVTLEMGKPLQESLAEVKYAAEFLRWFSEETTRINGITRAAPDNDSRIFTLKEPVGPCLLVTPWNFPLAMGTRKIGPALAAGCTAIVKPATHTPLAMNVLGRIFLEASLPAGVLSILPTSDSPAVVAAIMADSRLRKLSFTGSTQVGKILAAQAAENVLRISLELGGNAPLIVCRDADVDRAVAETMKAKLRNNGEACTAANVIYVHSDVAEQYGTALARRFDELVVGPGCEESSTVGPLIDDGAVRKVEGLVQDAIDKGARVLSRLQAPSPGSYCSPAVLGDVPLQARLVREEIFGPVAPIVVWEDVNELLEGLNASPYGLAGYLFTRDLDAARRFSEDLQVGMLAINRGVLSNVAAPFGGLKQSGYGHEGGDEGIEEYLDTKYVALHS